MKVFEKHSFYLNNYGSMSQTVFYFKGREVNGQSDSEIIVNSKIMIGIVIGTTLGFLVPEWTFISVLGELFVGALKAIAPILVLS